MNDLLDNARLYHDQAERMRALARKEENKKNRQVMLAIAEHYYLLHDRMVELSQLQLQPAAQIATVHSAG
jgi:hypothetical protein